MHFTGAQRAHNTHFNHADDWQQSIFQRRDYSETFQAISFEYALFELNGSLCSSFWKPLSERANFFRLAQPLRLKPIKRFGGDEGRRGQGEGGSSLYRIRVWAPFRTKRSQSQRGRKKFCLEKAQFHHFRNEMRIKSFPMTFHSNHTAILHTRVVLWNTDLPNIHIGQPHFTSTLSTPSHRECLPNRNPCLPSIPFESHMWLASARHYLGTYISLGINVCLTFVCARDAKERFCLQQTHCTFASCKWLPYVNGFDLRLLWLCLCDRFNFN